MSKSYVYPFASHSQFSTLNHRCQYCGLQFESSHQLVNHTNKFCTNSGFDTIAGLNVKLSNPNQLIQKQPKRKLNDSLSNALEEIEKKKYFVPVQNQLQRQLIQYKRKATSIDQTRLYMHASKQKSNFITIEGKDRSLLINQNYNFQKQLDRSVSQSQKKSSALGQQQVNKSNTCMINSETRKIDNSKGFLLQKQSLNEFNLLQHSDWSIKNMSEQQKKDYTIRKILQLQSIQDAYRKNRGQDSKFIFNIQKMKKFYQQLLNEINNKNQKKFGKFNHYDTRVSTPISKLDYLKQSNVSIEESINKKEKFTSSQYKKMQLSQIKNKRIGKRQDKIYQQFKKQLAQNLQVKEKNAQYVEQSQNIRHKVEPNQIIVIPTQQFPQTQNYQNSSKQTQLTLKYIQMVTALKDEQNKNFLQLLQRKNQQVTNFYEQNLKNKEKQFKKYQRKIENLENKYSKLLSAFQKHKNKQFSANNQEKNDLSIHEMAFNKKNSNFRISNNKRHRTQNSDVEEETLQKQYRQMYPSLSNIRILNIQKDGSNKVEASYLSNEEKILRQMQQEERDEFQLYSHLPSEIQKLKLSSIKNTAETRFALQKQVIKQQLQKLKLAEDTRQFQLDRVLLAEQIENEKKKIQIHQLMKKKVVNMAKGEFNRKQEHEDFNELTEEASCLNDSSSQSILKRQQSFLNQ